MDENDPPRPLPVLTVADRWDWDNAQSGAAKSNLAAAMAEAITRRRWFGAKTRAIASLEIVDSVPISAAARLLLVQIKFSQGSPEIYQVPLAFAEEVNKDQQGASVESTWMRVERTDGRPIGILYDPLSDQDYCRRLLALLESPHTLTGTAGVIVSRRTSGFEMLRGGPAESLAPGAVRAEQSNTSVIYGNRLILKVFRRVEKGLNPDIEISEFLTRHRFGNTPPLAGWLEYHGSQKDPWALAMLQAFAPNQGDAWQFTLDWLSTSLMTFVKLASSSNSVPALPGQGIFRAAGLPVPPEARAAFGDFLTKVEILGTRTAEMHLVLASDRQDPAFAPEPFSAADRCAYFHRCTAEARATFELLTHSAPSPAGPLGERARRVIALEGEALARFARSAEEAITVEMMRCHGDYHLGQVLVSGGDFMIIDFEGEPARSIDERRKKQLALRDVAGMIRSLHYASCVAAAATEARSAPDDGRIGKWAHAWYAWTSVSFLAAYLRTAGDTGFLPKSLEQLAALLDNCLLEKALYELRYELNNRPGWVHLPLAALEELLDRPGPDPSPTAAK